MILEVPYKSQLPYETGGEGERRWCGIVCLWMVMAYYLKDDVPSVNQLIGKYGEKITKLGFRHQDFLKVARDYGLQGFRKSWWAEPGVFPLMEKFISEGESEENIKEWMNTNIEESLFTLKQTIDRKIPVIVSLSPEFSPSQSTHLAIIVGYEDNYLVIHDPLHKGASFHISEEEFKKYWIRQAIIITD